ncbi:MAG: carboxypeptidase-like regulatory domain-containing protein [Saprospiraceae bacterium]
MKQTFLLLCFLTLFACRKDSETTTENESNHIPKVFLIDDFEQTDEPVTASVFGKVLNQNGYPVANAQVTLGSETLLTNDQGVFLFRETTMNATGTFIQVEKKPFFFAGGTRFFPKEGSENYVTIRLLPKETGSSFRSDEDVISEFEENLTIVLQANSLLLPNGTTYEGSVTPYIHQLRTERENMIDFLPGNLQGIDRTSKEVALSTFGAVALDFYSENGERLSLDEEKKVELSFLVSENHLAIAPEKISTWFFNEGYGLWQEQGDFVLEEGKYTGVIKQLGFFQLAVPSPKVSLSGSLQNQNEQPFPNLQIKITDEESLISSFAYTDNEGFFNLPIPSDKSIKLNVLLSESDCQVFEQAEEIVSTDKNLGNIILSETNTLALTSVTGTLVDCVTENISDYFVEVITEPQDYCYYNLNGNQINLSVPICNGGDVLSVNIKDMNDIHESGILTADLGVDLDLGETLLCGDGEAD